VASGIRPPVDQCMLQHFIGRLGNIDISWPDRADELYQRLLLNAPTRIPIHAPARSRSRAGKAATAAKVAGKKRVRDEGDYELAGEDLEWVGGDPGSASVSGARSKKRQSKHFEHRTSFWLIVGRIQIHLVGTGLHLGLELRVSMGCAIRTITHYVR
jgi:hypothetical protein